MVYVLNSQFNKELNFHFTFLIIKLYCIMNNLYYDSVRSGFKQNTGLNEIMRRSFEVLFLQLRSQI